MNLENVSAITSGSQVGLQWTAPAFEGGSPVVSYRVWFDNATGSVWEVKEETISETSYTATGLTQGQTYLFKVEAQNAYGYSFFSNVVEVLSA